jgi:hypothetical protein
MTRCICDSSTPLPLSVSSWHSHLLVDVSALGSMAEASLPGCLVDLTWARIVYATYEKGETPLSRLKDIIRVRCSGWTSCAGTGLLDGGGILLAQLHRCHTLASASACNSVCGRLCFHHIVQTPSMIEERSSFTTRRCGIHSATLIRTSSA